MNPNVEFIDGEPLDAGEIGNFLHQLGGSWNQLAVIPSVDSTNSELGRNLSAVQPGSAQLLIAEEQTGGLGRLGRTWSSAYGKGIALSIAVASSDVLAESTALPLVVGLAVNKALNAVGVTTNLKWPNDIIFENTDGSVRKCGGILVQHIEHAYIIGIGLNVTHNDHELPTQVATSLKLEGFEISRNELIAQIINQVEASLLQLIDWTSEYLAICASIGRDVVVHQLAGEQLVGQAISISPSGALVLATEDAQVEVTIGDVEHATIN